MKTSKLTCNKCGSENVEVKKVEGKEDHFILCGDCGFVYYKEGLSEKDLINTYKKDTEQ